MGPNVDRFRALARSSPWRWTSLHLTRHGDPDGAAVEAWFDRRTSTTRLRDAAGRPHRVAEAADGTPVLVEHGDPRRGDHQWAAMLDPVELSHHVRLADLVACERRGRETWTATAVPEPGYEPTCGRSPLLWSEISHRVSLDVGTGVVAVLAPHGEGHGVDGWSVEIHQVDGPDPFV